MLGIPPAFILSQDQTLKEAIKTHLLNNVIWPDFTKLPTEVNPTLHFNEIKPEIPLVLGDYRITPVLVNHQNNAMGFIVERKNTAVVFTQDTGPTDRIWEIANQTKNLKAIFTEVSFPNSLMKVAIDSQHHTPSTMKDEIKKMPKDIPIFLISSLS